MKKRENEKVEGWWKREAEKVEVENKEKKEDTGAAARARESGK